jgi:hypothetical protein
MIKKTVVIIVLFCLYTFTKTQAQMPEMNKQIIKYVNSVIGKKVDRGECWDLANQALIKVKADWDGKFTYGKLLNPKKDSIYPGDIIQYKNVVVKYKEGNVMYTETMKQHTSIVYKVIDKGIYEVAEQNTGYAGRKVSIGKINLSTIVKGKVMIYRPVPYE